ncbi:MAG: OmpA family protein [Candidatus Cloacimonetes bacterium]|nr:OmpA family protein [Candidatus Cloacimonadota bacterium]
MTKTKISLMLLAMLLFGASLGAIGLKGERYAISGTEYYQRGDYKAAIEEFLAAHKAADGEEPEYMFMLGRLYIAVQDTAKALGWFDRYLATGDTQNSTEAMNFKQILHRQDKIIDSISMRSLPSYLSSRNSDYGALLTPDNKYLWFTSLAPSRFDKENIWYAERLATGWARPYPVEELNTDKNEAIGSFSADGRTAYIFGNFARGQKDGDIYTSEFKNGKWQSPKAIIELNSEQVESHPMVFGDSLMFFASSREGGFGKSDIYLSFLREGVWTAPINLGPQINTPGNEQTPYLDADGRTLFFASDYLPGFGGDDLFRSVRVGKSWTNWSDPDNLGLPINSIRNDRHFQHVGSSSEAFISTDRKADGFEKMVAMNVAFHVPSSYIVTDPSTGDKTTVVVGPDGDVILGPDGEVVAVVNDEGQIVKPEGETAPEEVETKYQLITGTITDEKGKPLSAEVEVITEYEGRTYREYTTSDENGQYRISIPKGKDFKVIVNKEGYLQLVKDLSAPADDRTITLNMVLQPLEIEKVFIFQNILFDFDKATIKKESYPIVDEIVVTMLSNPDINIEISGHTCNMGSDEYNLKLSKQRAQSVVDYLISKGVEASRLRSEGFGETKPLNENKTREERELNRRVEVKVLK